MIIHQVFDFGSFLGIACCIGKQRKSKQEVGGGDRIKEIRVFDRARKVRCGQP
jgi:hypothetical protein